MGDLVYVQLPEVGEVKTAGDETGVVESVKAASDIYSPVDGEVIEVNTQLDDTPELVNEDPYDRGWLFKLKLNDDRQVEDLLTADQYQSQIDA